MIFMLEVDFWPIDSKSAPLWLSSMSNILPPPYVDARAPPVPDMAPATFLVELDLRPAIVALDWKANGLLLACWWYPLVLLVPLFYPETVNKAAVECAVTSFSSILGTRLLERWTMGAPIDVFIRGAYCVFIIEFWRVCILLAAG